MSINTVNNDETPPYREALLFNGRQFCVRDKNNEMSKCERIYNGVVVDLTLIVPCTVPAYTCTVPAFTCKHG